MNALPNQLEVIVDVSVAMISFAADVASLLERKINLAVATTDPEVAVTMTLSALLNFVVSAVPNAAESKLPTSPARVKAVVTVTLYEAPGEAGGGSAPGFAGGSGGDSTVHEPSSIEAIES